jgi:hypothetical protein
VFYGVSVSKVPSRGEPWLCVIPVSVAGAEFSETVSSIWPRAHKGVKAKGFRGDTRKDIKRVGGDDVREVRDHSNAVPGIRSLVTRGVNRRGGMRKSRGRVRM